MSNKLADPLLNRETSNPVISERIAECAAFLNMIDLLIDDDSAYDYPSGVSDGNYILRMISIRDGVIFGALEKAEPINPDINAHRLWKITDEENPSIRRAHLFDIAGHAYYFAKGNVSDGMLYVSGPENEVIVGTYISLDELPETTGIQLSEKLNKLIEFNRDNCSRIFEFGKAEIMRDPND